MKNIIVDANNLLYRAIGSNDAYSKKRGIPLPDNSALHAEYIESFFWVLYNSTEKFHNTDMELFLVWDKRLDPNSTNWRNDIIPDYKQQRDSASHTRLAVKTNTPYIKQFGELLGFKTIYPLSSECDDVMNYLANNTDGDSVLISGDQDFYQCVSSDCCVYNPQKNLLLTEFNFEEHIPVSLDNFIKWKAIKGDVSDNIKGLFRYGDVKSKKLVENWDELSESLSSEDHDTIKECIEVMDLNARPLSDDEIYVVEFQKNKSLTLNAGKLNKLCSKHKLGKGIYNTWKNYIDSFDLVEFFN